MAKARSMWRRVWDVVREVLGERTYDRYARYVQARGGTPLTPKEFYLSQLQRKYARPCRCC